jgi:Mg2+-importing ATPase
MPSGLTAAEAAERKKTYGPNSLPLPRFRFTKLLLRQFKGIFNLLLIACAVITYLLGEPIDALLIAAFVLISVGLSLFQEYKSNSAAEKLKSYLVKTITVRRGNRDVEVAIEDLVPGDILKLASGDIVPADATICETVGLQVDETAFTGESIPVTKVAATEGAPEALSSLLQGVVIIRGNAYAKVTATGSNTRLAHIAKTASETQTTSELTRGIDRISTFILRATVLTLIGMVIANIIIDGTSTDIPGLLIFSIALAVSVIPEALPLVMTFSLSRGALRLAKQSVIVKRLSSVQDLGSIEILCTDKTGTITENKLVYQSMYQVVDSPWHPLVLSRLTAHDLNERHPEPFDRATDIALTAEQRAQVAEFIITGEEAFDPELRSNGATVQSAHATLHIRRGSPEYFFEQNLVTHSNVTGWLVSEEAKGHRVLGVSYDDGSGPKFGGFVSFADTLKDTTKATLAAAKELGVKVVIITGDAHIVAEAIGFESGLIASSDEVIEASTFFNLPSIEQHKRIEIIRVFARTTPEQKLALIELLKEHHTIGFLGEGINDAPALKAAHVSIVVQSASDVARETADVVLLKSDLGVIIEGIRLGRETYANTLKYIRATLVSNFGNFYAVAVGSLFISFLPMLPKQLLLLNLLSDFPMIAIAVDHVHKSEVAKPQRYDFKSMYIIFITLGLVSTIFDFMWFALFFKSGPEVLQTNWFIASVLTEILLLISLRSMLPIEKAGRPAGLLIWLSGIAFVTTILLPIIPVTAAFFEFTPPTMAHLGLILSIALIYVVVSEIAKRVLVKFLWPSKQSF